MKSELLLYTRRDCCLCEKMKQIILRVAEKFPLTLSEVDVDSAPELRRRYGDEVPVLFIDGRKAFKFEVTARALEKRLTRKGRIGAILARMGFKPDP